MYVCDEGELVCPYAAAEGKVAVLGCGKRAAYPDAHVKMFVDIVRANILFNKLCDDNFQWVGGEGAFLEPASIK